MDDLASIDSVTLTKESCKNVATILSCMNFSRCLVRLTIFS